MGALSKNRRQTMTNVCINLASSGLGDDAWQCLTCQRSINQLRVAESHKNSQECVCCRSQFHQSYDMLAEMCNCTHNLIVSLVCVLRD